MRITVYGAGAVGAHLAARLAESGEDVSVVARGDHLAAMRRDGITLHTGGRVLRARVTATDDAATLGPQDLVLVTVKAPALPGIVAGVAALLGPETPIVFAMNGIPWWYFYGIDPPGAERRVDLLDPGGRWWGEIGPERAVAGVVYSANEVVAPGVVRHTSSRSELIVGEPDGSGSERLPRIRAVLAAAGIAGEATEIRRDVWEKLLGNLAYGPISSLTGATIGQILEDPGLRDLATEIMAEGVATAAALGVDLGLRAEDRIRSTRATGHKPSMRQDLERGRAMEIDAILAVPQRLARDAGVPTPALDRVLALLGPRARLAGCYPA